MDVLQSMFWGNTLVNWILAALTAVVVFAVLAITRRLIRRYLEVLARRTATEVDDVVANVLASTKVFFVAFLSLYAGSRVLVLAPGAQFALKVVGVSIVFFQLGLWGNALIEASVRRQIRRVMAEDPADATTLTALGFIGRLVLWTVLLLMALANLGIQIGPLLAGLGVGGIAVALALQNILGDLFASLSIVLDKPFVIGDFVVVGELAGTVEHVGLKTTRVRSLSGEQLVFSNSDLLSSRIRNYQRLRERRIVFALGVTYDTPRHLLEEIPHMIREVVEAQETARFDRAHFKAFGAFSLDFEAVYYVLEPDYNTYMDVQQAINLAVHARFETAGIDFAFPTQTLILERAAARRGGEAGSQARS